MQILSLFHFEVNQGSDVGIVGSLMRNGKTGITLVCMIINNDQYEMKSIDKLHYKFPAGESHNTVHESKCKHREVKGFESFSSCEFPVCWTPEATYTFRSKKNVKSIVQPLSGAPVDPRHMTFVSV